MADDEGNLIAKGTTKRGRKAQDKNKALAKEQRSENKILDFGNAYLVYQFIKSTKIFKYLGNIIEEVPELLALLTYRLCQPGPMYNAQIWADGTILKILEPNVCLSSQNISRHMNYLGSEKVLQDFFKNYLSDISQDKAISIVIDSTSTPNDIRSEFSAYGYCDGGITRQFRTHFVVDQVNKTPLFFRIVPGNIADVSTLQTTLNQLNAFGLKSAFILLDAGYTSKYNLAELRLKKIDFLMRLQSGRTLYKSLIKEFASSLEDLDYAITFGKRYLFVKTVEVADLYGDKGFAYLILDPAKKAKDMSEIMFKCADLKNKIKELELLEKPNDLDKKQLNYCNNQMLQFKYQMLDAGVFILISSQEIRSDEVLATYYTRQSVEQLFGFAKDDLDLLPIRCHNDTNINGYFFLQFILLSIYVELREKIKGQFTIEQALMITRGLKCKVYSDEVILNEATKNVQTIFGACSIIVPNKITGI